MNNSDADEFDIISIPAAPELYRGHGSAVSLQLLVVGKRHCRVLCDIGITRLLVMGSQALSAWEPVNEG